MRPFTTAVVTLALLSACRADSGEARGSSGGQAPAQSETPSQPPQPPPDPEQLARDAAAAQKRGCLAQLSASGDRSLAGLYRALCSEWVDLKIPGLALAVIDAAPDAKPVLIQLGHSCTGEAPLVSAQTPFRLGSISKSFTAALALGLVSEGKLERKSKASLVPGHVDQAGVPTPSLAALLRHRSGLGEIEPERLVALEGAWLPALGASAAAGKAGSYHYSNTGYVLVGAMLEAVTGRAYEALLHERVAKPLGLSRLTSDALALEGPACGHLAQDPDRHPIRVAEDLDFMPGDPRWLNPAGGVLSTAEELARFALAIGTPRLPGSKAMLAAGDPLPAEAVHGQRPDERYGDGLRSWTLADGTRAYGHSGNNQAFAAQLMFVPGRRAVALLSNCGAPMPASVAAATALLAD